jgi:hypothetical protein
MTVLRKGFAPLTNNFPVVAAQCTKQAEFLTWDFPHNVFPKSLFVFEGE